MDNLALCPHNTHANTGVPMVFDRKKDWSGTFLTSLTLMLEDKYGQRPGF
jgi:hypothetical protein